jgi:hypothetical protein
MLSLKSRIQKTNSVIIAQNVVPAVLNADDRWDNSPQCPVTLLAVGAALAAEKRYTGG